MIYLKSVLVGIVAVISAFVVFFVGSVIYLRITTSKEQGDAAIGWDPVSVVRPGPVLVVLAVFVAGFLWEFRRASR
jgi:hypothetical protein